MPENPVKYAQNSHKHAVLTGPILRLKRMRLVGMVSVCLVAPGVYGNLAWAVNAESTESYQKAEQALKEGQANEAIIHLKNAVRTDPDNIDARFLLGQFNMQRGDLAGAEKEFREARRRGMDDDKILSLLAQVLLSQGKARELLAEITIDKLQGVAKVTGYTMRARAHLVANDIAKAKEELDLTRPIADHIALFHAADAEVLQREGNYEAAEKAIDRAIELDPKFSLALWLKGELRRVQKDLPGSLEAYNKALEVDKNSMQVLIGRSLVFLALNRLDEAEADADAILKRAPEMPMALYIKSALLAQKGETEKALETLQPVEFRISSFMPAVFLLANLNLKLNRLEGAVSYAERYLAANTDRPDAIKLASAVYLRQKRYNDAVELLKPFEGEEQYKDDIQFLQLLGNGYLAISDYPSASRVFKALQVLKPEDQGIREQLAITSLGMGEQDEAVRELESMAQGKDGSDRVNLLLIITHIRNKEYVKAQAEAENYVEQSENNATAHNLLGSVFLAQDKRTEARAAFKTALKVDPAFAPAVLNLVQLNRVEKNVEGAKSLLKAHLEIDKGNEKVLTQLADISISEQDMNGALTWLLIAVTENPKSEAARLRLIDLQLKLKKPERALQTATDMSSIAPESPNALNALAQVQILNKQLASAVATYRKLTSVAPTVPQAHLLLGQALVLNGNLDEAKTAFDEAIKLAPNMQEPRIERIGLELKESGVEAAIKLAEKFRDDMPENVMLHILLGDVYLRSENFAEAAASLEKAHELKPGGDTMRRLYVAQIRNNKEDEAFAQLLKWTKDNPEDWETRLVLSTELIRRGDNEGAIAENEALNEKLPGRPIILNNLGWLYARKGDARGIELVRTAYELAPQSGEIQDTYGWLLVKNDKLKEGIEILAKAAEALPKSAEVQYHYAAALAQSGKKAEASEILSRVLEGKDQFDERKDAEALLASLKAG